MTANLAPAIVGGCIGVAGTLVGTLATSALTRARESRASAIATVERVLGLDGIMWTDVNGAPDVLRELRVVDARLRGAGADRWLRVALLRCTYAGWLEAVESRTASGTAEIGQGLLSLRASLEEAVVDRVLAPSHLLRRRRSARAAKIALAHRPLPTLPGETPI